MDDQMIFKRYEIKYLLTNEQLLQIDEEMKRHVTADKHGKPF